MAAGIVILESWIYQLQNKYVFCPLMPRNTKLTIVNLPKESQRSAPAILYLVFVNHWLIVYKRGIVCWFTDPINIVNQVYNYIHAYIYHKLSEIRLNLQLRPFTSLYQLSVSKSPNLWNDNPIYIHL